MRKYDKFQLFLGVSSRSEFATAVENKKAIDCKLPTTLLPYANCAWVITLHVQVNLARIILNLSHSGNTCAIGNLNFNKTEKILPLTPLICFSGSHCRRRRTGWALMLWPLCLLPVSCGVLTALTLYRVYRTSARPLRKTSTLRIFIMYDSKSVYITLLICASAVWSWSSVNRWINTEPDWRTSALWSSLRAKPRSVSRTSGGQWYEYWWRSGISSVDHPPFRVDIWLTNSCIYGYLARNHLFRMCLETFPSQ